MEPSLLWFALSVLAALVWVLAVVVVLPRVLGRALAFTINRGGARDAHVSITALYCYPLAGKAMAQDVCFTGPDAVITIDEFIVIWRWWRRGRLTAFDEHLVDDDDAEDLGPVAREEQERAKNSSRWLAKQCFRVRRWWRGAAVCGETRNSTVPPPLFSFICVGMQVRLVNLKHSYDVLERIFESAGKHSPPEQDADLEAFPETATNDSTAQSTCSSDSRFSQDATRKSTLHHALEMSSLRISTGALYVCDVGSSPLVRVTVKSAKIRYTHGAPECSADLFRQRYRIRIAGLHVSTTDRAALESFVELRSEPDDGFFDGAASNSSSPFSEGNLATAQRDSFMRLSSVIRELRQSAIPAGGAKMHEDEAGQSHSQPTPRTPSRKGIGRYRDRESAIWARRKRLLPCLSILRASTAVIEYVCDEPGPLEFVPEGGVGARTTGGIAGVPRLPPPVLRANVLLGGSTFAYDSHTVSCLQMAQERLYPKLFNLMPVADQLVRGQNRRMHRCFVLDIEVTANADGLHRVPVASIAFVPRERTWHVLQAQDVRRWQIPSSETTSVEQQSDSWTKVPPTSRIAIHGSIVTIRAEIPYQPGRPLRANVTISDIEVVANGVVEFPMCQARRMLSEYTLHYPDVWNAAHHATLDIELQGADLTYVPDFIRIVDDVSANLAANSRKPDDVRYFVPFQMTTKVHLRESYSIRLATCRNNAWEDIHRGIADEHGVALLRGESGEAQFVQASTLEYLPDVTSMEWSLSLPRVEGWIVLPSQTGPADSAAADEAENGFQRAKLVFQESSKVKTFACDEHVSIKLMQCGDVVSLVGRVVSNEAPGRAGGHDTVCPDAVNESHVTLRVSSVSFDLNPHHTQHILNLVTNYAGAGGHTLTLEERERLDYKRQVLALDILSAGRHPTSDECAVLGLDACLPPSVFPGWIQTSVDDISLIDLDLEGLVIKLHALPDALCPFESSPEQTCTLDLGHFVGSVRGCRDEVVTKFAPSSTRSGIVLYPGTSDYSKADSDSHMMPTAGLKRSGMTQCPSVRLSEVSFSRRVLLNAAHHGMYYSEMSLDIGRVDGCVLDQSVACLSRFGAASVVRPAYEEAHAMEALVAVVTIHLRVHCIDVLLLAVASREAEGVVGSQNRSFDSGDGISSGGRFPVVDAQESTSVVPVAIAGVMQLCLRVGLRICLSNLGNEERVARLRLFVPESSAHIFTPWGRKTTSWIDETVIRAQVAHASAIRSGIRRGVPQGRAVMHKGAELSGLQINVLWDARPRVWSRRVQSLQKSRVHLSDQSTARLPKFWQAAVSVPSRPCRADISKPWWAFITMNGKEGADGCSRDLNRQPIASKTDIVMVNLCSLVEISLGPEAIELANDMIELARNLLLAASLQHEHDAQGRTHPFGLVRSNAALVDLWRDLNSRRGDTWTQEGNSHAIKFNDTHCAVFHLLVSTAGVAVSFLAPLASGDVNQIPGSNAKAYSEEQISITLSQGLCFGFRDRIRISPCDTASDVEHSLFPNAGSSTTSRINRVQAMHLSVPQVSVYCSSKELVTVLGINGRSSESADAFCDQEPGRAMQQRDRSRESRVMNVRVASCAIGKTASGLDVYGELGRLASVYGLMGRALSLELNSLLKLQNDHRNKVANQVFGIPFSQLKDAPPAQSRLFLYKIITGTAEKGELFGGVATDPLDLCGGLSVPTVVQALPGQLQTRNLFFQISLHKFSIVLCGNEALLVDGVACDGQLLCGNDGCSTQEGKGHVLKLLIKSVAVTVRDEVATAGLQTVSAVASYVRKTSVSLPMLRYEARGENDEVRSVGGSPTTSGSLIQRSSGRPGSTTPSRRGFDDVASTMLRKGRSALRMHAPFKKLRSTGTLNTHSGQGFTKSGLSDQRLPSGHGLWSAYSQSPSSSPFYARGDNASHSAERPREGRDASETDRSEGSGDRDRRIGEGRSSGSRPSERFYSFGEKAGEVDLGLHRSDGRDLLRQQEGSMLDEHVARPGPRLSPGCLYAATPTVQDVGPPRKKSKTTVQRASIPAFSRTNYISHSASMPEIPVSASAAALKVASASQYEKARQSNIFGRSRSTAPPAVVSWRHSESSPSPRTANSPHQAGRDDSRRNQRLHAATLLVSCAEVTMSHYRRRSLAQGFANAPGVKQIKPDLFMVIRLPRAIAVVSSSALCRSVVVTTAGVSLSSANTPDCELKGSLSSVAVAISVAHGAIPSALRRLIVSARVSDLDISLHAVDLRSVLLFREGFKADLRSIASAAVKTRSSVLAMARATRLTALKVRPGSRVLFSTIATDLSMENFQITLLGFHPADKAMLISYKVDGLFGSAVAAEENAAALMLGGRVYGHGLVLSASSWPVDERFDFPALDTRGVQWAETTGAPTQIKVNAGPLTSTTSFQGLRHVLFTVSGLMAFQNRGLPQHEIPAVPLIADHIDDRSAGSLRAFTAPREAEAGAPFIRSFAAWERTKAVRMECSVRPMSIRLVSGDVVATFDISVISGIFEWNKLVASGVQLHAVVQVPRVSLAFSRLGPDASRYDLPSSDTSLLVALKNTRVDIIKSQQDLTHKFVIRIGIGAVSGQLRPWRLVVDAAVWAEEQDFVADLQSINLDANSWQQDPSGATGVSAAASDTLQHRIIIIGADVHAFVLKVLLLDSEQASHCRLVLTVTEFQAHGRVGPTNLARAESQFIGVFWDGSAFLSSHHAQLLFAVQPSSHSNKSHFGSIRGTASIGTWVVCPRKDVLIAYLAAKSAKENRSSGKSGRGVFGSLPDLITKTTGVPAQSDGTSTITPNDDISRKFFDSIEFTISRSKGFIEGLGDQAQELDVLQSGSRKRNQAAPELPSAQFPIPPFNAAFLRHPGYDFDLIDIARPTFSGKRNEFPEGCLSKVGHLFSELFGAVASGQSTAPVDSRTESKTESRTVSRDFSALVRFGESRYIAQEEVGKKLNTRFAFYAGRNAGILASVAARPHVGLRASSFDGHITVVTGVSPVLSLEIKPILENTSTQRLQLSSVRLMQGYSPALAPHSLVHINGVKAMMDVMTLLLTREWFSRKRRLQSVADSSNDVSLTASTSPASALAIASVAVPIETNLIFVIGEPASITSSATHLKPQKLEAESSLRVQLQLSQPLGRVGLLVRRLHVGVSRQRTPSMDGGNVEHLATTVDVAVHQVEARAHWEYLSCTLGLSRFLFRFDSSGLAVDDGGVSAAAVVANFFKFECQRDKNEALTLEIDGIAAVCMVPSSEIAVQNTTMDVYISSSTGKTIQRLLQLYARLSRESRRQVESLVLAETRMNDSRMSLSLDTQANANHRTVMGENSSSMPVPFDDDDGLSTGRESEFDAKSSSTVTNPIGGKIYLSGDRLSITMHGYKFEESHWAQLQFLGYSMNYEQQAIDSCHENKSPTNRSRNLSVEFDLLDVQYSREGGQLSRSVLRMPNPHLKLSVQEHDDTAVVDLMTNFESEVVISSSISHYEYLRYLIGLYGEGRRTVVTTMEELEDRGDLRLPVRQMEVSGPWGGRTVTFSRLVLAPRLEPFGELTPDLNQIGKMLGLRVSVIPEKLYDVVMLPVGQLLEKVCRPLLSRD